jgi:hypothetical protein
MAETAVINVENNGYRNVILRGTLVSDGSGITDQKIYDATSSGTYGVVRAGQTFYPGVHTTVVGFDYDAQDLKLRVQWEATINQDIFPIGNAPEDFNWRRFGGIRVPAALAGATGSILISTVGQQVSGTFFFLLYLRKNVPVS